ncbi:hypothetical protein TKK_0019101 [Trichogramma kaykai]
MSKLNFFVGGRYDNGDDDNESYWGTDGDESCEGEDSHCGEGQIAKPSHADSEEVSDLEKLKSLRKKFNLKIKSERLEFLEQFKTLIRKWKDEFPNLRDIFRPREIDRLLADTTLSIVEYQLIQDPFIDFVIDTGYKDKPKLDDDGKPLLRRTTALHHHQPVNDDIEVPFFEECDEQNRLVQLDAQDKLGNTPLHLVFTQQSYENMWVAELLLRRVPSPNLVNEEESTPLHIICNEYR